MDSSGDLQPIQHKETDASKTFLVQNVTPRLPLTLDNLALREDISVSSLPEHLRKASSALKEYAQTSYNLEDKMLPSLDFIYQCWQASRSLPPSHTLAKFAHTLDSFETFLATYMHATSSTTQVNLAQILDRFIYTNVHDQRILTVDDPSSRSRNEFGTYNTGGEWVELPQYLSSPHERDYVDTAVLREVIEKRNELTEAEVYHSTGSASLRGIASQQAILASRMASQRGEEPIVGEYLTYNIDQINPGARKELISVFAARHPKRGYALSRWFDEFHVTFGISIARQQAHLTKIKSPITLSQVELSDMTGEGIQLGPEIPLDAVSTIYVDFAHKDSMIAWTKSHCPNANVVSYEAFEVLQREREMPRYRQPQFTAEQLLQTSPVKL